MLRVGAGRDEVKVVADQLGCPTYTGHLAPALIEIAEQRLRGVLHVAGGGSCTWWELCVAAYERAGLATTVLQQTTAEFGAPAPRPAYSVLGSTRPDAPILPRVAGRARRPPDRYERYYRMKLLATGAAGFIGANFVHYTMRNHPEYEVVVLDALTYAGNRESLKPVENEIEFVHGDICDRELVDKLVSECDTVVHFAAESHVDNSLHDPEPFIQTNLIGTYTILEAIRRHGARLHHISTDEVFGDLDLDGDDQFTEQTPVRPVEPVLGDQGRLGPARARLGALVRHPRHALELRQQLRALPARREVHPAPDHERASPARGRSSTGSARTCASGPTSTTTTRPST